MTGSIAQYRVVISLAFAVTFALVFLTLGFGLGLSIAAGFVGATSGLAFCRQPSAVHEGATVTIIKQVMQSGGSLATARPDIWQQSPDGNPQQWGSLRKLRFLLTPFFQGSPAQRVAVAAFLAQAGISAAAIIVFRIAQAAGVDLQFFDASSIAGLFANAFRFSAESSAVRAQFDHLFLPLVSLYAITIPLFGLVFLGSLPPILRDFRAKWRALLLPPMMVLGLWLILTYRGSRHGLQDLIIDGNAWGYFAACVFSPLFFLFISAALPNDSGRS